MLKNVSSYAYCPLEAIRNWDFINYFKILNKYDIRISSKYNIKKLNKFDIKILSKFDIKILNKYYSLFI